MVIVLFYPHFFFFHGAPDCWSGCIENPFVGEISIRAQLNSPSSRSASAFPCPAPPSLSIHGQSPNTTYRIAPFPRFMIHHRAYLYAYHTQTSHAAAKKAALQIRFVIVGGGAAGLACAVALRRVGHHVILLEKDTNFVGVSNPRFCFPSPLAYPPPPPSHRRANAAESACHQT